MTTFKQKAERAREAYVHARVKHPKFPMVITDRHGSDCAKNLQLITGYNNANYDRATAENILDEEVCEIMDAYTNGTKEQALNEVFDAIAVLFRMADKLEAAIFLESAHAAEGTDNAR